MSEATRAIALQEAVKRFGDATATEILATANLFNAFLESSDTTKAIAPATKAVAPKAVRPAKPVKTEEQLAQEAAAAEAAADTADESAPTREAVGLAVESMLKANKRTEAVALLKKFGAASVSALPLDKYIEFLEAAEAILLSV